MILVVLLVRKQGEQANHGDGQQQDQEDAEESRRGGDDSRC